MSLVFQVFGCKVLDKWKIWLTMEGEWITNMLHHIQGIIVPALEERSRDHHQSHYLLSGNYKCVCWDISLWKLWPAGCATGKSQWNTKFEDWDESSGDYECSFAIKIYPKKTLHGQLVSVNQILAAITYFPILWFRKTQISRTVLPV